MIRLSSHVRAVNSPDGGALLDLKRGKMFQVNGIGSIVLELSAQGNSEEAIALEISERCGIEVKTASADIRDFVASLKKSALLQDDGKP